jgi:hypothetical protein
MTNLTLRKPHGWLAMSVAVALTFTPITASPIAAAIVKPAAAGSCSIAPSGTVVNFTSSQNGAENVRRRAKVLRGEDAKKYLRDRDKGAERQSIVARTMGAKAIKALSDKGFTPPTGDSLSVTVFEKTKPEPEPSLLAKVQSFFVPSLHAQNEAAYFPEGYLWWNSWDDGESATWEGQFGGYEYELGNYMDGGVQFRIDTQQTLWTDGDMLMHRTSTPGAVAYGNTGRTLLTCTGACLGSTLFLCAFTGPGTIGCAVSRCLGGFGICAMQELFAHASREICQKHPGGFFC